jgi:hypothetical protein
MRRTVFWLAAPSACASFLLTLLFHPEHGGRYAPLKRQAFPEPHSVENQKILPFITDYLTTPTVRRDYCDNDSTTVESGSAGVVRTGREAELLGENMPQCYFADHRSHVTWDGARATDMRNLPLNISARARLENRYLNITAFNRRRVKRYICTLSEKYQTK